MHVLQSMHFLPLTNACASRSAALFVALTLALVVGCDSGPPLGEVSGTITLEGEPIEQATITFSHSNGRSAFARTDANGFYELTFSDGRNGALLGENVIAIETGRASTDAEGNYVQYPETLPAKYHVESEMTREIKAGKQVFDFALSKE